MASGDSRGAQRGATLSLLAFSTCIILITLGSTYVVASQNMYRLSIERTRLAQAREAAEAGIALGSAAFAGTPAAAKGSESLADGTHVTWEIVPSGGDHALIHAEGSFGADRDRVAIRLTAEVARTAGDRRSRVLKIVRE